MCGAAASPKRRFTFAAASAGNVAVVGVPPTAAAALNALEPRGFIASTNARICAGSLIFCVLGCFLCFALTDAVSAFPGATDATDAFALGESRVRGISRRAVQFAPMLGTTLKYSLLPSTQS